MCVVIAFAVAERRDSTGSRSENARIFSFFVGDGILGDRDIERGDMMRLGWDCMW